MANQPTDVRDFNALLAKSRLLSAEEVDGLHRRWREENPGADDQVEPFARYLVGRRALTPWQAAIIQRGRAEGFFLDGYKILDQVGKGQMGGVYKAVHALGQTVALKILPASRARDQRVLGRFQREARLLTQLDHPNVVRAFQVGEAGGRYFIVMEFLEGETLDEVLARRKRLPVPEAVRLVRQALDGLQHLHDQRTVHRDLKPANLMIVGADAADSTLGGTVKILDVGLGRELFGDDANPGQVETQLTVEGAVVGTPDYMAPEQAKDARSADIRADVYSLGCVLYRCVTGRTPFPDGNIMTQMLRHATEDPAPMAEVVEGVPAGLQGVLDRFLAKNPADRVQTPAEASAALARFEAPGAGARPVRAEVTPAFRQWLETESHLELSDVPELPPPPAAPAPAARADGPKSKKPATEPAPALPPAARPKPGTGTAVPLQAPPKSGTAATPALPAGGRPAPPKTAPPAVPSWQPAARGVVPVPTPVPVPVVDEVEVELVVLPPHTGSAAPVVLPDDRPLWDPSRRDLIMLAIGGGGIIGSVGVGFTFTKLLRALKSGPSEADTPDEK